MNDEFVKVYNLWKIYKTDTITQEVLKGVSFNVEKGEFISIIGPSGSGKSTLLNIIGGLDRPSKGYVEVGGFRVSEVLDDEKLSRYRNYMIGFVFQLFYLIPRYTALQNVELPLIPRGVPPSKRREMALKALEVVGLKDKAYSKPNQLSGGEQQRVAIARAIVGNPKVILADEPTGNLDSKSSEVIMEVFRKLNKELGVTIVMVTHNLELIWYCDRVIRLSDGKVIRIYEKKEYKELLESFVKVKY
ncbi:MAG: ABC transporter ATP-binding protein [Desulfurococcales archaeon ex4484_217_2]|nr:MAG: ABC transporter ATP-binding protein [Desulfurococcales archaeon ex4484_217_2]